MSQRLTARHNHSTIVLEVDDRGARLSIDDTLRARANIPPGGAGCYLSTPLQTAYEYHSLVEAWVRPEGQALLLQLRLDGVEIARGHVAASCSSAAAGT